MAETETEELVQLKLMVDKVKRKVLFAEADADFVDCLFSLLTLPLGTIVRLLSKAHSKPTIVGCFTTLYESVMNLDSEHFSTELCKDMLLRPKSSFSKGCPNLKINIDDTEPTKYFICPKYYYDSHVNFSWSIYNTTSCIYCGDLMTKQFNVSTKDEAFVIKPYKFLISDDLHIMHPGNVIELLNNLSINDMNGIEEKIVKLGLNQFLELLKWMFRSATPLTDLFVSERDFPGKYSAKDLHLEKAHSSEQDQEVEKMKVKVVMKKSNKEVMFVEAQQDFIDFLFSLLTIPLGQMLHILNGKSCVRSIDNLYKSLQALDSQYFISEDHKNMLLIPKVAPYFNCNNQLFQVQAHIVSFVLNNKLSTFVNPKLRKDGNNTEELGDYVRGPAVFMVMDNLAVTPYSPASIISILNRNKLSLGDLEERTVSLGISEGLSILRASLNSTCALTNGLFHKLNLKEPKQEI